MTEPARKRPSLSALRPILPYARRRIGRIALALVALTVASAATLVVPYAMREMVDRGFHGGGHGSVHIYFALLIGVVAVLAVASACRYYLVMTIGERIVADLRGDFFRHLTTLDQTFFDAEKTGEIVSRLSADTTQLKATFGSSASIALRNMFMFVGVDRADDGDQPETVGLCADRHSASSCCRFTPPAARCASARAAPRRSSPTPPPSPPRISTPRASCRPSSPRNSPRSATRRRPITPMRRRAT